jgi:hypothetical protein
MARGPNPLCAAHSFFPLRARPRPSKTSARHRPDMRDPYVRGVPDTSTRTAPTSRVELAGDLGFRERTHRVLASKADPRLLASPCACLSPRQHQKNAIVTRRIPPPPENPATTVDNRRERELESNQDIRACADPGEDVRGLGGANRESRQEELLIGLPRHRGSAHPRGWPTPATTNTGTLLR